jgi:hypothetical protein
MHFALSDLVTDITQNAAESGADLVELEVWETRPPETGSLKIAQPALKAEFRFTVRDNGKGMDKDELERAKDPFITDGIKHPNRKVGLGIPFLLQTAEQSGGGCDIRSHKGTANSGGGTVITAWFDLANVDTPPVGDIPGMFRTILLFAGPRDIVIRRTLEDGARKIGYSVRKSELADVLGDLENAGSLVLLDQYLRSLETDDDDTASEDEDREQ